MIDAITRWLTLAWGNLCTSPPVQPYGHHGITGPLFGNILVAGAAGIVTLACIAVALRMLIRPGEGDRNHPKYRVLDADH